MTTPYLDQAAMAELNEMLHEMNLAEIERFCEGTMRAAIEGQRVFRERFPEEWARFDARIESGEIK